MDPVVAGSSSDVYAPSVGTSGTRPTLYIRRADVSASLESYKRLLDATKAYTAAMSHMSEASADLAAALQDCSTLKGAHASGASLQAAGGLHYLKSNYEQILCDTIWKECSIPLLSHLDAYRQSVQERQQSHEVSMEEHKRVLKSIEAQYHKSGSRHARDLQSLRTMLTE